MCVSDLYLVRSVNRGMAYQMPAYLFRLAVDSSTKFSHHGGGAMRSASGAFRIYIQGTECCWFLDPFQMPVESDVCCSDLIDKIRDPERRRFSEIHTFALGARTFRGP